MRRRIGIVGLVVTGTVVAFALAAFASPFASSRPDGLERVAQDHGFLARAKHSATAESPVADYSVDNVSNEKVGTGLAGVIGVSITLVAAGAVFGSLWWAVRRRAGRATPVAGAPPASIG